MKDPKDWTQKDLHVHLQHALDVEFWTIPLYLTALYSIKGLSELKPKDYPEAAKLVQSVVIQEMLHMEIVCNLCTALGYEPRFPTPKYDKNKGIPFIHPKNSHIPKDLLGYQVKVGPLDAETLKLFCVVEMPQPWKDIEWAHKKSYESIAELYTALKEGLSHHWLAQYVGDEKNTRQKNIFSEYHDSDHLHHGFSQTVNSLENALNAIEAIMEQGEGADSGNIPEDFRPPSLEDVDEYHAGWFKGELCHYRKFNILFHNARHLPPVHEVIDGQEAPEIQTKLEASFEAFRKELERSYALEGSEMTPGFWQHMMALPTPIMDLWKLGVCPVWK
ncbi:MAG: hypothetical protein COB85_06795 [Bacteroidetes bacterium]|nr:MAG: hypothetical protein COB85_06795 [Bacteroidota bacterium]